MTRILTVVILILSVFCAHATTVCTRNDKVVIGLSSQQVPTLVAYDDETFEWSVYYDGVGVVRGVFSRSSISSNNGNKYGNVYAADGTLARGNYQGRNDGGYAYNWCKITHPFESEWFYVGAGTSETSPSVCATRISTYNSSGAIRGYVFQSVAMADE